MKEDRIHRMLDDAGVIRFDGSGNALGLETRIYLLIADLRSTNKAVQSLITNAKTSRDTFKQRSWSWHYWNGAYNELRAIETEKLNF